MPKGTVEDSFYTKIAGVTFENEDGDDIQDLLEDVVHNGDELEFIRKPDNPYDPNAIAIYHQSGSRIGYLSRKLAADLAPQMDAGYILEGHVREVTGLDQGGRATLGCNIRVHVIRPENAAAFTPAQPKKTPTPQPSPSASPTPAANPAPAVSPAPVESPIQTAAPSPKYSRRQSIYARAKSKGLGMRWFDFYAKFLMPFMLCMNVLGYFYLIVYHGMVLHSKFSMVAFQMISVLTSLFFSITLTFLLKDFQGYWINFTLLVLGICLYVVPGIIVGFLVLFAGQTVNFISNLFGGDLAGYIILIQLAVWLFVGLNAFYFIGNLVYFHKRRRLFSPGTEDFDDFDI